MLSNISVNQHFWYTLYVPSHGTMLSKKIKVYLRLSSEIDKPCQKVLELKEQKT